MYWHEDKLQGYLPDYPGNPLFQNGAMTSNVTGNLKTFSSNELAYFSLLFLGIGLYGNAQFLFFDPQWAKVSRISRIRFIHSSHQIPCSSNVVCVAFSCVAILRIEGCLNSTLQRYSRNPPRWTPARTSTSPTSWSRCSCPSPSSCTSRPSSRRRTASERSLYYSIV